LHLASWLALSAPRQRQALLAWLDERGWPAPEPAALHEFQRQLVQAGAEALPLLRLPGGVVFRFDGAIQAMADLQPPAAGSPLPDLSGGKALDLPEWGGRLEWTWRAQGLPDAALAAGLALKPRCGGEKLALTVGRREVKDLLREARLPPPLRQRWPLLYAADGQLLALPGIAVAGRAATGPGWWPLWRLSPA
jgi:tRNA(Ile)-lysidine synthase